MSPATGPTRPATGSTTPPPRRSSATCAAGSPRSTMSRWRPRGAADRRGGAASAVLGTLRAGSRTTGSGSPATGLGLVTSRIDPVGLALGAQDEATTLPTPTATGCTSRPRPCSRSGENSRQPGNRPARRSAGYWASLGLADHVSPACRGAWGTCWDREPVEAGPRDRTSHEVVRPRARHRRPDVLGGTGRGLRVPRSERRRQDHDDPEPPRLHPPDRWASERVLGARLPPRRNQNPPARRLPARRVRPVRTPDGARTAHRTSRRCVAASTSDRPATAERFDLDLDCASRRCPTETSRRSG